MKKLNITGTTVIKKNVDVSNIGLKNLPEEVQDLINSADNIQVSGFQGLLGHIGRQLIFEALGHWVGKKFIIESIGGKWKDKHITWKE